MFDIDSGKLLIVAVIALIVIGPKELPRVLRQVGQAVGKMRRMATEFQGQFMDAMKEADLADIRKELDDLKSTAAIDYHFDPARDIQAELSGVLSPSAPLMTDTAVPSPGKNFNLPAVPTPSEAEPIVVAEDAALAAEPETTHVSIAEEAAPVVDLEAALPHQAMNGASSPLVDAVGPKRKVRVRRRRSSFNVVLDDKTAWDSGEPLSIRQRVVRAKAPASYDMSHT